VRQLMQHPDFSLKNPNRARSVIFSYCNANPGAFHRQDAAGYVFWSERVIELDAINPQVAARLARALDRWKKLADPGAAAPAKPSPAWPPANDLSNDVREVVTRALAESRRTPWQNPSASPATWSKSSALTATSPATCACCWKWWPAPANASASP
jgi:hypothetical protein